MKTVDGLDVDKGVSGKMNKKDKRSRKTVSAIQSTLLELLCTKRVQEIKIVDLCTAADINRTTFYLHFPEYPTFLKNCGARSPNAFLKISMKLLISINRKTLCRF